MSVPCGWPSNVKPLKVVLVRTRSVRWLRSLAYSDVLITTGVTASVGTVGDSYDNALTETINGLYKAELIHATRVWESLEAVELATMGWVHS